MSLAARFQQMAKKIMDNADDVPADVTYMAVVPGVYSPATGTTGDVETAHVTRAFVYRLDESELDWFPADWIMQKAIIATLDMPLVTPKDHDYFLIDGERWEIQRIKRDPANAASTFFIRRP